MVLTFQSVRIFAALAIVYALMIAFRREEKSDLKKFCSDISGQWSTIITKLNDESGQTKNLFCLLFDRKNNDPKKPLTNREILIVQLLFQMIEDFYIEIGRIDAYKKENIAWVYHMAHIVFSDDNIVDVWNNSRYLYGNKNFILYVEKNFIQNNMIRKS